ncbi:polyketide synthase [Longimycelium tulufanense]|uniref:Polyketide synthase n=1 Tax=Longimycelium tulufanense TaxID=907463 RepID=A0A8J3C7R6_9PSEU|nr:type I polyketide synthase [Longimycelium tulufanense]GGM51030.1 polyketide synthase [Longimycelium tulufanense]
MTDSPVADAVLGVSPFGEPNARLVAAVGRAGGLGVLDLGRGDRRSREALARAGRWSPVPFGVRVAAGCALEPADLSRADDLHGRVTTVLLGAGTPWRVADLQPHYRVLVEVTSHDEAARAVRDGADGLVARGNECGGRVGELSTFVLLQQLVAARDVDVPVWAAGGIGPRTAAAAVVGGAAGVVLDTQLALLAESDLPGDVAAVIRGMDGSETTVVAGYRVLTRRGPDATKPVADGEIVDRLGARDLRTQLVPVGQDGFLADRFARRWGDAATAVRAVISAIQDTVRDDRAAAALRPGSPMSRALGTRFPVVQGPMTRVSDQPPFADAVAADGGLPFLALALANRDQTRAMLEQTSARLRDRPWGVGVLGFAPEEIRAGQLEVIHDVRPPFAIIAGGRPSQADALEQEGIETFLHVPSARLLAQFLESGARKFVFEGAECGGHVGPRNSFPLWEAQIEVLTEYLDRVGDRAERSPADELRVLFAGGIHDERSAAMVAALAAPLAERGVAVGVLMGTAYLFTEQAVECGAIQPLFQERVVTARETELLETAPGHATRCVRSSFTESFRAVKDELRERGVSEREAWQTLEGLNLGKLRLASKGVERVGPDLVQADRDRQDAEGMFMAGEVAVLRSGVTTIGALHETVSTAAADFLTARAARLRAEFGLTDVTVVEPSEPEPLDIAVVGMSCMFPDAPDLASFWRNVVGGADAVREVPAERWDTTIYYSPEGGSGGSVSKWGGFLPDIPFDALRYGIPPTTLSAIEPVQLLALEAAWRALVNAGYGEREFNRQRTSVVFGAESGSDLGSALALRGALPAYLGEVPAALGEQLPELTEDTFPGMLANVISGRIANRLDLGGANYTVDAACASSLAALDVACKELVNGTSEMVLCGGADLHNGIQDYLLFTSVHALSPTGRCRTFDNSADGIVLGEGVACVVLKRLADAERDGDKIYAVIKGVGRSSDGKALGLTAPRPAGQRLALERAYRNAAISPAQVGMVEAHGTGTVVGDRTELTVLGEMFSESGAEPASCAVGSVKSQIGHTKCAAGLAGLIKVVLALYTGVRPPTLHVTKPNPAWDAESSPFTFSTVARPWATPVAERIAGVSAFGFGGTNFHVVVQGYDDGPPPAHGLDEWPAELFTFRGADHEAALREVERLVKLAGENGRWRLRDLAFAAARRAESRDLPVQIAVVADDEDQLRTLLQRALAGEDDPAAGLFRAEPATDDTDAGKVAFLFPGQGSQEPGMLADLFVAFPELQRYLQLGSRWADVIYPPTAFDADAAREQQERLTDTRVAQPALGIVGLASYELLAKAGVRPDMMAGHSYGELVALCAAGAFDPPALLDLSEARAEAILSASGDDPGAMAAVSAEAGPVVAALAEAGLAEQVVPANMNSPKQTVISGPTPAIEEAVERLRAAGLGAKRIKVACAFHSPQLAQAGPRFAEALAAQPVHRPEISVWSNGSAARYREEPDQIRAELVAQISSPVRFVDEIEAMYQAGARVFVEAGPGSTLTRLVSAILVDRPHKTVTCAAGRDKGLRGFLLALAQLATAGVRIHTSWLFQGRDAVDAYQEAPVEQPRWVVNGQLVRTVNGDPLPNAYTPPRRVTLEGVLVQANGSSHGVTDREELVAQFLQASREMVAAQRDVLLSYLGGVPAPATLPTPVQVSQQLPAITSPTDQLLAPEPAASTAEQPTAEQPTAKPAERAQLSEQDLLDAVLGIISERTGYPVDMIEPDLDLEADLSIDSIKRAEIVGELATKLGGPADGAVEIDDTELEELAKTRTAASIVEWLVNRLLAGGDSPTADAADAAGTPAGTDAPVAEPTKEPALKAVAPQRLVLREVTLPETTPAEQADHLRGKRFVVLGEGTDLATRLAEKLAEHGAEVVVCDASHEIGEPDGTVDGVLHLAALSESDVPVLPDSFPAFRAALLAKPRWLVGIRAVAGSGHHERGVGMAGLFRTISREHPDIRARLVEVDPARPAVDLASDVLAELLAPDEAPVVSRAGGPRVGLELVRTDLGSLATNGAGPAGEGAAEADALGLDRDSVVLLVGGARGITARFAATLAAASRCRIELVGRTPLPAEPADPAIAAATDATALRAALVAQGLRSPAEIEQAVGRILAQREVTATLAELHELGSQARYQAVDVRDPETVHKLVKEVHAEHGRLDGIVYAAGVIEDRLAVEKQPESFRRVFDTKVSGARELLGAVAELPDAPRFAVLFGSIAAVLGNRGQIDYAAANDALQSLGAQWAARTGGRGLTVHWGPWAPVGVHGGMVSPELGREYARRGVELIDPEEGTLALLRELAWGEHTVDSVVYAAPGW